MSIPDQRRVLLRRVMAVIAIGFGLLTIFSGGRVLLLGVDPGYIVFRPLLIFNTVMGVFYVIVGVAFWRDTVVSVRAAGTILALNLTALVFIGALSMTAGGVAVESLRAMSFRTVVWLALAVGARITQQTTRGIR